MSELPWAPRVRVDAARWGRGWVGDKAFHNMCKAFVRSCFAIEPSQSGTAKEAAEETRNFHPIKASEIDDVPAWVPLYFDTGNAAEHVVFTLWKRQRHTGKRLCITTDAADGKIGIVTASSLLLWGPVWGWGEDMDGKRVWEDR